MQDNLNKFIKVIAILAIGFGIGKFTDTGVKVQTSNNVSTQHQVQRVTPSEVQFALNRAKGVFQNTHWVGAKVTRNFPQYVELITTTKTARFYYDPKNDMFLIGMLINPTNRNIKYLEGRSQ